MSCAGELVVEGRLFSASVSLSLSEEFGVLTKLLFLISWLLFIFFILVMLNFHVFFLFIYLFRPDSEWSISLGTRGT